jgi:hypothetical protein
MLKISELSKKSEHYGCWERRFIKDLILDQSRMMDTVQLQKKRRKNKCTENIAMRVGMKRWARVVGVWENFQVNFKYQHCNILLITISILFSNKLI